jgi:flagellar motility protein MotE (MotC chaperone)
MIPNRNGTQIRSHAQKFFSRIKDELGIDNHLEYINNNTCEELQLYRYDEFCDMDEDDKVIQDEIKRELALNLERKNKIEEEKHSQHNVSGTVENASEDSTKF